MKEYWHFEEAEFLADMGDPEAQLYLAMAYFDGYCVTRNVLLAMINK